jgi:hypothetical protein
MRGARAILSASGPTSRLYDRSGGQLGHRKMTLKYPLGGQHQALPGAMPADSPYLELRPSTFELTGNLKEDEHQAGGDHIQTAM